MNLITARPEWGLNLQPGWCGFITRECDIVGDGIEWFERYEQGIPFVHCFVVAGPSPLNSQPTTISIIEANARAGVRRADLGQYLDDADCQLFIRLPIGWTPEIGGRIVAAAEAHLGEQYDFGLIAAEALANSWLGHWVNWFAFNAPDRFMSWLLNDAHKKICSELVSVALQSQHYLRLRGCLRQHPELINPKELGNDDRVFHELTYKLA